MSVPYCQHLPRLPALEAVVLRCGAALKGCYWRSLTRYSMVMLGLTLALQASG